MSDLIRRSDVIEALKDNMVEMGGDDFSEMGVHSDDFDAVINGIPTIEPKRGEWIGEADGYYNGELVYDTWYCSNCDYCIEDEEQPTFNYCPNCGADMRGENNETDKEMR